MRSGRNLAKWHFGVGSRGELEGLDDVRAWVEKRLGAAVGLLENFAVARIEGAEARLDLTCADGLVVEDGGTLAMEAHMKDGALDVRRMHPVVLTLSLHVDLYAPTGGNRELARLNGPRLEGFLIRLETLPADLFGIEAPGYARMAHAYGFRDPDQMGPAC